MEKENVVQNATESGEVLLDIKDLTTYYVTREIGTCKLLSNAGSAVKFLNVGRVT